jgi:hypothetical protein
MRSFTVLSGGRETSNSLCPRIFFNDRMVDTFTWIMGDLRRCEKIDSIYQTGRTGGLEKL